MVHQGSFPLIQLVIVLRKEGVALTLRFKYFIGAMLITISILSAGVLFVYNGARSYLISGLGREAVSMGRTVASSLVLDHKGLFSLQSDNDEHSEVENYLKHIQESNNTLRHINIILQDKQAPIPLLKSGDSEADAVQGNSKIKTAIATGKTEYDKEIRLVDDSKVIGAVVPIIRNGKLEGLVCVDLIADNLAAVLSKVNQYTFIGSILLLILITVTCYKASEVLADRQELYSGSVNSLVASINAKDSYTQQHSLNVASYATILARELKLSAKDVRAVNILARLHDVGKIGVRDDILNKSTSLNEEEFGIMRMHPVIGARILANIKAMRKHIAIVRNHHERFDGKGYPDGLKGEEIPLAARILSVADSFDAMTTTRPYRAALSHREAIIELEKNQGTQFDPLVVEAFVRIYNLGKII